MDRNCYSLIALFSAAALAAGCASTAAEPRAQGRRGRDDRCAGEVAVEPSVRRSPGLRGRAARLHRDHAQRSRSRRRTAASIWNLAGYKFLESDRAPDTVNPSLWRQAQLNQIHGLFKVTDRVYQVRGFDLSNMTIVEGDTGLIVIDPLLSAQTAKAGLDLYRQHRPAKPVVAVIYTHSHADHFGGVRGVVDEADVKAGKVAILAPAGFMEHAVAENVIAGTAMSRRALYMYGATLPVEREGSSSTPGSARASRSATSR